MTIRILHCCDNCKWGRGGYDGAVYCISPMIKSLLKPSYDEMGNKMPGFYEDVDWIYDCNGKLDTYIWVSDLNGRRCDDPPEASEVGLECRQSNQCEYWVKKDEE